VTTRTYTTIRKRSIRERNLPEGGFGFTIAEMLLVVLLIALMAGAVGGYYTGTYKKALVEKSAKDFFLGAKYARILAIERQSSCRMELDAVKNAFALVVDEYDEAGTSVEPVAVRDIYSKPVKFAGNVKFENIQIKADELEQGFEENENKIEFFPEGTARAAVIQIGDGSNHFTITISAGTGKAKIYPGTAENVKSDTIDLDGEQG